MRPYLESMDNLPGNHFNHSSFSFFYGILIILIHGTSPDTFPTTLLQPRNTCKKDDGLQLDQFKNKTYFYVLK